MLRQNEKIYIQNVWCHAVEDDYNEGEIGGICSSWDDDDLQISKTVPYASVADAIRAVCDVNRFKFKKENWENFGIECGKPSEYGRFETNLLVDDENAEATSDQIDMWKRGEIKLYACNVSVVLEVRTEPRRLTEDEAKSL